MQAAASAADPSDVGAGTAANLAAQTMASRMRYAEPAHFQAERPLHMPQTDAVHPVDYGDGVARASQPGIPTSYNLSAPYPAKYDLPEPFKHRMAIKQALRDTAPTGTGAVLTYQMGEEEIDYVEAMERQGELADFDRYVSTLVNPRNPGNLKWLYEIYPDYVHRRINQVNQDFEFAMKNQLIDMWGVNTLADLQFKFMVDQGKISGPQMATGQDIGRFYKMGTLAPWFWEKDRERGLKLPFASATTGRRPLNRQGWALNDDQQPYAGGRSIHQMAASLHGASANPQTRNATAAGYQQYLGMPTRHGIVQGFNKAGDAWEAKRQSEYIPEAAVGPGAQFPNPPAAATA